jgi:hypothetical protein
MTKRQRDILVLLPIETTISLPEIVSKIAVRYGFHSSKSISATLSKMVNKGYVVRVRMGHYQRPEGFDAESHARIQERCATLFLRTKKYLAVHPATYKGIARMTGTNHKQVSSFYCMSTSKMPVSEVEKIEQFLTERGF